MKKRILSLTLTLSALSACNDSPLLNHKYGENPKAQENEDCPLNFSNNKLCSKIEWIVGPNGHGANSFNLKFWDSETGNKEGPYVDPEDSVNVQLWMPSMGHGSAPVTVERQEEGIYKATNVQFIMPGDWDIRVKLMDAATVVDQDIESLIIQ